MRLLYFLLLLFIVFTSCDERLGSLKPLDMEAIEVEELPISNLDNIPNPTSGESHLPRLKAHGDKLYMTWVEQKDSLAILNYSIYYNQKWTPTETVVSGTDWFINWADFPTVAINDGTIMATFLQKSAQGTYDYDVKYTLRDAATGKWSIPKTLHNDGIAAEHGFVSLLPYQDGFFATWLDGRNTKTSANIHDPHEHSGAGAMTLRSAVIGKDGTVSLRTELDNRICDCCNTAVAQSDQGIVIVYRDRSDGEIETRDIYRTIWKEDATIAGTPVFNDNWKINGCPVNGPAIDADGNKVVTAWFTAANDTPQVLVAFSSDGGLNFGNTIRVDTSDAIGRVDVVLTEDGSAMVLWMEPKGEDVVLQLKKIYKDGSSDAAQTITQLSGERMSGFPQIERIGNNLFISYTDVQGEHKSIKLKASSL